MRVAVLGAGAMGSLLGARLSREADLVLITRAAHAQAIGRSGLRVEGLTRGTFRLEAAAAASAARGADLVILTTKAYDTASAASSLRRAGVRAPVLSLQNGLTNLPQILRALPEVPVLGGSTTNGVTFLGPGRIRHAGRGKTVVGVARGGGRLARSVAALLTRAGVPTKVTGDLPRVLWEKAAVNAAVNPVTAVLRVPNGEVLRRPEARLLARLAALEAARVARAQGIDVVKDPWASVERVLRETAANRSSMLQDVEAGRRTEIEAITGEIVRVGRLRGVPVPVNRALLSLVRAL